MAIDKFEVGKTYKHHATGSIYDCLFVGREYIILSDENEEYPLTVGYEPYYNEHVEPVIEHTIRHVFRVENTGEIVTSNVNNLTRNYKRIGYLDIEYNPALDDVNIKFVKEIK